jgi:uncharacterized protein (DUF58 family)
MKVRKISSILLKTSLFLALSGLLLVSYDLIALSALPILILLLPYIPAKVHIINAAIEGGRYVGEVFSVRIALNVKGFGVIKIQHTIPEFFEIVEGSNTLQTFVIGKKTIQIFYKAKPSKRGIYDLGKIVYQTENPIMVGRKVHSEVRIEALLEVKQKIQKILKVGNIRGIAKSPIPDVDISRIGVPGTDFREIKEYKPGDAMKFINWKATARKDNLMVNRYEVEGKKAVWLFLDANKYMQYGTAIKNYLEAAIEAANSLTYYFTSRGYRVGMYVVGHNQIIYPDTGKRQFRRISDTLLKVEASNNIESLEYALESCKGFLITYKPLVILITRVEYSKPLKVILKISKLSKQRRIPVEVIALKRGEEVELATMLLKALQTSMISRIRSKATILEWDIDQPLTSILIKEISGK